MSDRTELTTDARSTESAVSKQLGTHENARQTRVAPAVDVFEDAHGITLFADLPGVPREKLDVRVQDGHLQIEAQALVPTPAGLRLQHAEMQHAHFARAFALSPDFDVARIDAQLKDGVLKLTIPRRDEAKPRRIEVQFG